MRHMGQEVVIRGRNGRSFKGIMDGFDPPKKGYGNDSRNGGATPEILTIPEYFTQYLCFLELIKS